jgi:hypothetical protein
MGRGSDRLGIAGGQGVPLHLRPSDPSGSHQRAASAQRSRRQPVPQAVEAGRVYSGDRIPNSAEHPYLQNSK